MYSYLIISIHPRTLCTSICSYFNTYRSAMKSLREEAQDYITKYKRYQTVIYINNDEEIGNHPDVKYFLKISDQFPNRIEVYERRKIVDKGWLWNAKKTELDLIKVFSVINSNLPEESNVQSFDQEDYRHTNENNVNRVNNVSQVKMIEELREALELRRTRI